MTTKELLSDEKEKLVSSIEKAVKEFSDNTGLKVESIDIKNSAHDFGLFNPCAVIELAKI